MIPFTVMTAVAVPLDRVNVDTDQIVPARFLRKPRSEGYEKFLFHDVREKDSAFDLNRGRYCGARILVAADNFGCGSSREAAVWALSGAGLRAWIAASFGDIFYENSFKNGCLPIALAPARVATLRAWLEEEPGREVTVDLPAQEVRWGMQVDRFDVDPFRKECLVAGLDEIDLTLRHENEIAAYERRQSLQQPWLAPGMTTSPGLTS
jgi:3-isopropylmalate/(R)-2-methylmalate dehydratase small subunit